MEAQTVGHYMIEHELGHGQNGTVYLARDVRLERRVAIKVLNRSDEQAWAEMLQEARLASSLDHRYICTVYDVGEVEAEGEGPPYIAMEYVDGLSLADGLEGGALEPLMTLRLAAHLCDALAYAHEHGVVHGDIKPSNVLITPDAEAKLADFGCAARSPRAGLAPVHGDIWALGRLLYQMATGEDPPPPTLGGSPAGLKAPPSVPRGLAAIIERCTDTDLARCYHSAREVLHDLRMESAHPGSAAPRRRHALGRHQLAVGALALAVVLALIVTGVEIAPHLRPSESPGPFNQRRYPPPAATTAVGTRHVWEGGAPGVKVWLNSRTMKYHCPDSPWYGRTLTGRYLTQKEAQEAGYAPAYGTVCP
jgi:serine/threonine-protein kinase